MNSVVIFSLNNENAAQLLIVVAQVYCSKKWNLLERLDLATKVIFKPNGNPDHTTGKIFKHILDSSRDCFDTVKDENLMYSMPEFFDVRMIIKNIAIKSDNEVRFNGDVGIRNMRCNPIRLREQFVQMFSTPQRADWLKLHDMTEGEAKLLIGEKNSEITHLTIPDSNPQVSLF